VALELHKRPHEKAIPTKLSDALRLAADLAEENELLQQALKELMMHQLPEVLLSKHILELMGWSKSTLSQEARHPDFPHLDGAWSPREKIRCLKIDFYNYLKNRNHRGIRDIRF